jgi:hypothetical protein
MTEGDINPMSQALRCTATSKRTGEQCKGPAVNGWRVCRFHGAGGGHAEGPTHPTWKHGLRSRIWVEARKEINALVRETRQIERMIIG